MQLLPSITRGMLLIVDRLFGGRTFGTCPLRSRGFSLTPLALFVLLALPLLGLASDIVLRSLLAILFLFDATAVLRFDPFALEALGFQALAFQACRVFGLAALLVNIFLLLAALLL